MSEQLTFTTEQLPLLVADVGGTNARFALLLNSGEPFEHQQVLAAADYPNFADALSTYLRDTGVQPVAACLAVAAPIMGDEIRLTNRDWHFSISGLSKDLNIPRLEVINDFEALAMALPFLKDEELAPLCNDETEDREHTTKVVLGPGTGLGVATLVASGDNWVPLPGEGGHVTLAPGTPLERRIVNHLSEQGHVSYEDILSGPGLERLFSALIALGEASGGPRKAPEIVAAALSGEAGPALCLDTFCGILGSYSGNLALITGARGGVYLGGGILPRIIPFVRSGSFRERFEDKGPMSHFVHKIPTHIITAPLPALTGAAAWLARG